MVGAPIGPYVVLEVDGVFQILYELDRELRIFRELDRPYMYSDRSSAYTKAASLNARMKQRRAAYDTRHLPAIFRGKQRDNESIILTLDDLPGLLSW